MNVRRCATTCGLAIALVCATNARALPPTYNVPPNAAPSTLLPGETLNLGVGGAVGFGFSSQAGSVINVQGGNLAFATVGGIVNLYSGRIGTAMSVLASSAVTVHGGEVLPTVSSAGQIIVLDGTVSGGVSTSSGGKLAIQGGTVGAILASAGSQIELSGGVLHGSQTPLSGTTFTMSGGSWKPNFGFVNGSTFNLSGGTIDGPVSLDNSAINILCQSASVGGSAIPGLLPGGSHVVTQRNTTLSGVLSDGSPFAFDLNTGFNPDEDLFPASATIHVTLVPEPAAGILAGILAIAAGLRTRRTRRAV